MFDFAENLIAQQRAFAKQMLRAASQGQQAATEIGGATSGSPLSTTPSTPEVPAAAEGTPGGVPSGIQALGLGAPSGSTRIVDR